MLLFLVLVVHRQEIAVRCQKDVDDQIVNIDALGEAMYLKIIKDPKLTVSLKSDENSVMETITDIHTQLRKAQALKLNYSSLTKKSDI